MQVHRNPAGFRFWAWWVLASTVGWFAGFILGFELAHVFEPLGVRALTSILAYFGLGVGLGSMVGLMQWLVLRKRISAVGWWAMANAAGLAVAGSAGFGIAVLILGYSEGLEELDSFTALSAWVVVVALGGALAGILQWRVLQRQVQGAGLWVLASTIGWGLSMAVAGSVIVVGSRAMVEPGPGSAAWFLGGLVAGGVALGMVTGAAMARLLKGRVSHS